MERIGIEKDRISGRQFVLNGPVFQVAILGQIGQVDTAFGPGSRQNILLL